MARQLLLASLLETSTVLKRRLIFDGEREYWVHPINIRRETYGEFHHLFEDLKKDEERFKVYFRMNLQSFQTILGYLYTDLQKYCTNFRDPITSSSWGGCNLC